MSMSLEDFNNLFKPEPEEVKAEEAPSPTKKKGIVLPTQEAVIHERAKYNAAEMAPHPEPGLTDREDFYLYDAIGVPRYAAFGGDWLPVSRQNLMEMRRKGAVFGVTDSAGVFHPSEELLTPAERSKILDRIIADMVEEYAHKKK